jgi:hypothetical protein
MNELKKIAIMQPYFFPYIGYFQLINYVDKFVIYDNIKYTKKGWINRNRVLNNNSSEILTVNLKKSSDFLMISEKYISESFDNKKVINKLAGLYKKAPFFTTNFQIIENILLNDEKNLFKFIEYSILKLSSYLNISSLISSSSELSINHSLKKQEKIFDICNKCKIYEYINPIGGEILYNKDEFLSNGIKLNFLRTKITEYKQFSKSFIPSLSIIDVLMFNSVQDISKMLTKFEIV